MNQIDLNNRIAVVTGGAQGIGRAVAERFLASGASVALWDQDITLAEQTAEQLGAQGTVIALPCDVADLAAVEAAAAGTNERFGRIDILVNNAGIAGPSAKLWDYKPADWQSVIDIDLTGVFNCCRAVIPGMIDRNYGRIVNVSSVAGKEGNPNAGPYSAAKAGVIALTKSLSKEVAQHDIAVNSITPAAANTRILEQISQEHIDYMLEKIPRGRLLKVAEAAAMIAWMACEENSFTTGATFDLSGGRATY
ncbi:MAG: SDR family NAD(P)-dependent oxidoreductase [Alphaproteobacteria bacterium]